MNNNIMQIMQMAKSNPQQIAQMLLNNSQMMQNPMAKNFVTLLQNNDMKGIEEMAKNICQSNGTTPEGMIQNIKNKFGMK